MNDFDFDELDKAVNELASKTTQEHGVEPDPSVINTAKPSTSNVPQAPLTPDTTMPVAPKPTPTPELDTNSQPPKVTPAKRPARLSNTKPQGPRAFMDIVPPTPRKPASRVGVTIKPTAKPEEIKPVESAVESPKPQAEEDDQPTLPITPEPSKPHALEHSQTPLQPSVGSEAEDVKWPDPLDFNELTYDHENETSRSKGAEAESTTESHERTPELEAPSTPFIPDAKVEKRPLGAYSDFKQAEPEEAQPEVKDELTPAHDGTFHEPAPEPAHETHESEPVEEPANVPEHSHEKSADEPEKQDLHAAAMMSIPKQYHTEEKPADTGKRSVYDTKEYHPPLADKALKEHRRSSTWIKVLMTLIIVALLAGGAYALYLYLMPR